MQKKSLWLFIYYILVHTYPVGVHGLLQLLEMVMPLAIIQHTDRRYQDSSQNKMEKPESVCSFQV